MGSSDEEIARLRRRLREDPRSTVFVALAEAQRRAGRVNDALATLRAGFRVHAEHAPARVVLARLHLDQGQRELALTELEDVVRADPHNVAALGLLARLYFERGRVREAAPLVDRLEMAGDPQAAALRQALSAQPLAGLARTDAFDVPALAARWESRGDLRRARRVWQRLAESNPGHEGVQRSLDRLTAVARAELAPEDDRPPGERAVLPGALHLEEALDEEADRLDRPPGARRYGALARALWRSSP